MSPAATVAIASCREAIERSYDEDEPHLAELEAAGVPVVPTRLLAPGDELDLGAAVLEVEPTLLLY